MKLRYIFISIFAVLLMSHNTYAIQLGIDVEPNWTQYTFQPYWTYTSSGSLGYKTGYEVSLGANAGDNFVFSVNRVRLQVPAGMALNKGGYLVYSFKLDNFKLNDNIDGNFISACVVDQGSLNSSLSVLNVEYQTAASTGYQVNVYLTNNSTINGSNSVRYFEISSCSNTNELLYLKPGERIIFTEANFYKLKSDTNYTGSINDVKNAINNLNSKLNDTNNKIDDIKEEMQKEENTANDNIEEGNNAADSSSDDAENATSSLISVIGQFVGAVTTASPSNCIINGNMGNFSMGQIDLCANPVPTFVQIISSLILIAICVPFAIVMFNRFINLFRSFQQ